MLPYTRIRLLTALGSRGVHAKPLRPWSTHKLTNPTSTLQNTHSSPLLNTDIATMQTEQRNTSNDHTNKGSLGATSFEGLPKRRRPLRPLKAALTLTPKAVEHLKSLLDSPTPKLIRIGVRNRGCSGLTYNLEYVEKPGKFDEEVIQDGVKVLIDSKALLSVIGSNMDWVDDKLSSRFVFSNPNSKGECGCGESFMV